MASNWHQYKAQVEEVKSRKNSIIASVSTDGLVSVLHSRSFRAQGFKSIPSYRECLNAGIIRNVSIQEAKSASIVFISHRWLGNNPDDEDRSCISAMLRLSRQYEFLWVDFACFDMQIGVMGEMQAGLSLLLATQTVLYFHETEYLTDFERINSAWSRLEVLCYVVKCELLDLKYDRRLVDRIVNASRSVRIKFYADKRYVDRFKSSLARSIKRNVRRRKVLLRIATYLDNLAVVAED